MSCWTTLLQCKHCASSPTRHSQGCPHHYTTPSSLHIIVLALCSLVLTLCWLSRYDRGLLLDLSVCAFFCKVSALFCKQNSNPGSPTKTTLIRGSFFLLLCCLHEVACRHCCDVICLLMQASCRPFAPYAKSESR